MLQKLLSSDITSIPRE